RRLATARASVTDGGESSNLTCNAWLPLRLSTTPNSTRWPVFSSPTPDGSAALCTKTSPPSSLVRNPKPFSWSYHFPRTVGTLAPAPQSRPSRAHDAGICTTRLIIVSRTANRDHAVHRKVEVGEVRLGGSTRPYDKTAAPPPSVVRAG